MDAPTPTPNIDIEETLAKIREAQLTLMEIAGDIAAALSQPTVNATHLIPTMSKSIGVAKVFSAIEPELTACLKALPPKRALSSNGFDIEAALSSVKTDPAAAGIFAYELFLSGKETFKTSEITVLANTYNYNFKNLSSTLSESRSFEVEERSSTIKLHRLTDLALNQIKSRFSSLIIAPDGSAEKPVVAR